MAQRKRNLADGNNIKKPLKTVMAFGTFDLFHPGHVSFLKQAKKHGKIIVVIARDKTVMRVKGELPSHNEIERQHLIKASGIPNKVILGSLSDRYEAVKKYRPDIICLGYDQKFFVAELKNELKKIKLKTKVIRLKPFQPKKYKSSILKAKVSLRGAQATKQSLVKFRVREIAALPSVARNDKHYLFRKNYGFTKKQFNQNI